MKEARAVPKVGMVTELPGGAVPLLARLEQERIEQEKREAEERAREAERRAALRATAGAD